MGVKEVDFSFSEEALTVKKCAYSWSEIVDVKVQSVCLALYAVQVFFVATIFTMGVWFLCPSGYAQIFSPLVFLMGTIVIFRVFGRHKLVIESSASENALSTWVVIARGNSDEDLALLNAQAELISQSLCGKKKDKPSLATA